MRCFEEALMMIPVPLEKDLIEQIRHLRADQQHLVLDFARTLASAPPKGAPGQELLRFAGSITTEDLHEIERTIDQGCEQVDSNEW